MTTFGTAVWHGGLKDGKGAISTINSEKPDIVLLDLMMPGISGFDVIEAIHATPEISNVKVIVMTAKVLSKNEIDQLNKHTESILEKGTKNIKELLSEIETQISSPNK